MNGIGGSRKMFTNVGGAIYVEFGGASGGGGKGLLEGDANGDGKLEGTEHENSAYDF